jgi:hypothetical protein
MIFGTDWPGAPGMEKNARALLELGLERETLEKILHKNARQVYRLETDRE